MNKNKDPKAEKRIKTMDERKGLENRLKKLAKGIPLGIKLTVRF